MNPKDANDEPIFYDYQIKAKDALDFERILTEHGIATVEDYGLAPRPGVSLAVYGVHYLFHIDPNDPENITAEASDGYWAVVRSVTPLEWSADVEIVPPPFLYIQFA